MREFLEDARERRVHEGENTTEKRDSGQMKKLYTAIEGRAR